MNWSAYWLHLRPRSWAIVFAHYLCGALLLLSHISREMFAPALLRAVFGGILWAICLNGGTLALNSAFDRDEGDVGYLDNPPPVPPHLASFSLALMALGCVGAFFLFSRPFFWIMAVCVFLSVLYSVPPVRLKAVGGADLIINMLGYGAATIAAGALATDLLRAMEPAWVARIALIAGGFAFLFGAFYPMTQIYQIPEDSRRGDRTLAIMLGPRRSLWFALVLEVLALLCHLMGLLWRTPLASLPFLSVFLVLASASAWIVFTLDWLRRIETYPSKQGMYRALWLWALSDVTIVLAYGPALT